MRLLYKYVLRKSSRKECDLIIDVLKGRVATSPPVLDGIAQRSNLFSDTILKFFTTSRLVEGWIQSSEDKIGKMARKKVPVELWMILGGYGSGKSHIKEYLLHILSRYKNIRSLELKIASLLAADLHEGSAIDNAFALILIQTREHLDSLFDMLSHNSKSIWGAAEKVKNELKSYFSDNEFVDIYCEYELNRNNEKKDFKPLQEILTTQGSEIFLPLMKLYKIYLGIDGFCLFIDEFEDVKLLSEEKRGRFIESIRALYDTLATARLDPNLPSFKLTILCALTYWEEIRVDTRSQALETRTKPLEIPQLTEDEIITIAEKLYALYKCSGRLKGELSEIPFDFTIIPKYLAWIAGLEAPLTPRFVISTLMDTIEKPGNYILYTIESGTLKK